VLSAGSGTRLRPLSAVRPKPLCTVGGVALLDLALGRVAALAPSVAVNVRHHAEAVAAHVAGRGVHVSDERAHPEPLGTAGAVAALRPWLDGRAVLVVNGDTWTDVALEPLLDGWDGERVRVLVHGPPGTELVPGAGIVASLVPAADVAALPLAPLGLSNGLWWPAQREGRLDSLAGDGRFLPCDTPRDYLAANLQASGGESVLEPGARVEPGAEVVRSVVWRDAVVPAGEVLVDAVRYLGSSTVLVR